MSDPLYTAALEWLVEPDLFNPGVRYFALTDLLDIPPDSPEVVAQRRRVMAHGPVPAILANQAEQGYWHQADTLYYPKYQGSVWSIMFLAQLGADGSDERIQRGCQYLLDHGRAPEPYGGFSYNGGPAGLLQCLQGNLVAALLDLGWQADPRLASAIDWLARSITGEGISPCEDKAAVPRYYRSSNCGPGFACTANNSMACAWAATKAVLGLGKLPPAARTPAIQAAIQEGVDFLISGDPARAGYPNGGNPKPSRSWFQFGYPLGYVTDILQILEALAWAGTEHIQDPRLAPALELLISKQEAGRWKMEYTYNGKTWVDIEEKGRPSKWVTLRALRVLKRAGVSL